MRSQQEKRSLFAQKMNLKRAAEVNDMPVMTEGIKEKSQDELELLSSENFIREIPIEPPVINFETNYEVKPKGLTNELASIHTENLKKLQQMSQEEIKKSLKEIESLIDPDTIQALRKRGEIRMKHSRVVETTMKPEINEEELWDMKEAANKTCLHLDLGTHEFDRVRYDGEGNIVQRWDKEWKGDCQGFTLRELAMMLRSSVPAQRVVAVSTIVKCLGEDFDEKIRFLYEECEIEKLIIFALTEKNVNMRSRVILLMKEIFTKKLNENLRIQQWESFVFPMVESKDNGLLRKEFRQGKVLFEEEEVKNSGCACEENKGDFIAELLNLGVLECFLRIPIEEINEILVCFALHSASACYYIARHPIFTEIINAAPVTYRLLNFLVKASMPIAYKVRQALSERILADALVNEHSRQLLYSLACHNQNWDIRVLALEACQDANVHMFAVISKTMTEKNFLEFSAFAELALYKYIQQWEIYFESDVLYWSLQVLYCYLGFIKDLGEYKAKLLGCLEGILRDGKAKFDLKFDEKADGKYVKGLNQYFSAEELEGRLIPRVKVYNIALKLCVRVWPGILNSLKTELLSLISHIISLLLNALNQLKTHSRVPSLLCYRLKPLIYFSIDCQESLQAFNDSSILTLLPFLSTYDEALFLELLSKLQYAPEYYNAYINSDKNLSLSIHFHTSSQKLSTHYLGLNENPYLPLPFNWLTASMTSEKSDSLMKCLSFISRLINKSPSTNVSSMISDVNAFFVRKDVEYFQYLTEINRIVEGVVEMEGFETGVNNMKNSVLNTVKDFIANSYLEKVYLRWVCCFLRDSVDKDLFFDVIEEIQPMLGRVISAINGDFIGGIGKYSRLLSLSKE